jgi:hypothetical protein
MDTHFWQNLLLIVLLVPYAVGICISTYYAQKQRRTQLLREARKHMHSDR